MKLASIHVYPVKGARGVALRESDVLRGGLRFDRRFMILDEGAEDGRGRTGRFVTQREEPRLALLETAIEGDALVLSSAQGGRASLPLAPSPQEVAEAPRRRVRVFDDETEAVALDTPANDVVSRHLGRTCTLVYMPDDVVRPVEAPYGEPGDRVGFADAYPVLVASLASLADLNAHLPSPVPMDRFRPNLVVDGGLPWAEDEHGRVRIGTLELRMPKRCARCNVTLVDQATAQVGKEPLRTLAKLRADGNKVYFAQNAIPDGEGVVHVGDDVTWLAPLRS